MGIKGLDTFEAVALLMRDPASFDAKLAEIKEATAKYQEVVEAVVALSQVNDYTKSITAREAESIAILEAAKKEVAEIKTKATATAEGKLAKVKLLEEALQAREQTIAEKERQLSDQSIAMVNVEIALQDRAKNLEAKEIQLKMALTEVEERKARLAAALNA